MENPFLVRDCALAVVSTGISAASIVEFKEAIAKVPAGSLYYHFWGRHFRTSFVDPGLHNDFSRWTYLQLHDRILSERLSIIDPTEYVDMEELRRVIIEIFDQRLDEIEFATWSTRENRFHFLRSVIVVFGTATSIQHPHDLKNVLPTLSTTSIFFHFIDARKRTQNNIDDFSCWLSQYGSQYTDLLQKIQHIDPYFLSLAEQKQKLSDLMNEYFS